MELITYLLVGGPRAGELHRDIARPKEYSLRMLHTDDKGTREVIYEFDSENKVLNYVGGSEPSTVPVDEWKYNIVGGLDV